MRFNKYHQPLLHHLLGYQPIKMLQELPLLEPNFQTEHHYVRYSDTHPQCVGSIGWGCLLMFSSSNLLSIVF
eukprot:m.195607 g.195607  ORF g.195607 m.195607 type:complete len:72 (-) comp13669_c2_seq2:1925-2140(-)